MAEIVQIHKKDKRLIISMHGEIKFGSLGLDDVPKESVENTVIDKAKMMIALEMSNILFNAINITAYV